MVCWLFPPPHALLPGLIPIAPSFSPWWYGGVGRRNWACSLDGFLIYWVNSLLYFKSVVFLARFLSHFLWYHQFSSVFLFILVALCCIMPKFKKEEITERNLWPGVGGACMHQQILGCSFLDISTPNSATKHKFIEAFFEIYKIYTPLHRSKQKIGKIQSIIYENLPRHFSFRIFCGF